MNDPGDRNPVEALAEEFLDRFRRGERPSLTEYARQHPDLAAEIRDLFPALVMLEDVRPPTRGDAAAPATPKTAEGQKLERLGDYRILREVGRGGMGVVYEAEQESLGRHVALKVLPLPALLDPQHLQRFQREARAAARLHHTNIVPVFGVGEHNGLHYYVMQFIQGQGLDQIVADLRRLREGVVPAPARASGLGPREGEHEANPAASLSALAMAQSLLSGVFANPARGPEPATPADPGPAPPLPSASSSAVHLPGQPDRSLADSGRLYWQSVARIGIQVAEALAYAHGQGTLHRDIKPSNLLLDTQGVVWVTDFGLAKGQGSEDLTHTGDVVGTVRYMAPERFQGRGDARSDLYALGLTLYELLTLRPAFAEAERRKLMLLMTHQEPARPRKLNPAVPRDLETVVLKAIASDPAHRYPNAAELAEDLKRFRDDKPIHARRVSEIEKLWRWGRRHPGVAGLAAAFVLALLLGVLGTGWKWREADGQRRQVLEAKQETDRQRDNAVRARNASQRVLAETMLDRGTALAQQGDIGEGLCWMLEALQIAEEDSGVSDSPEPGTVAPDLARLVRTNLSAWTRQTHRLRQFSATGEIPWFCAFTQDGKRFVTATGSAVQAWDAATGRPLGPPLALKRALALSPDGAVLLTRTDPGRGQLSRLQRCDARTGEPIGIPLDHPQEVLAARFAPDGKQIATGCTDGKVRLWDSATGKLRHEWLAHEGVWIRTLAFSPDGKTLAAGSVLGPERGDVSPAAVYLYDLTSGRPLGQPLGHRNGVRRVAFSPDGRKVLSSDWDGTVQAWDAATGKPVGAALQHPKAVDALGFTPDGRTIVTGGADGLVRWWDGATGLQLAGTLPPHRGAGVTDLAVSPDGQTLGVTVGWPNGGGEVALFRLARDVSRPAPQSREGVLRAPWTGDDAVTWFQGHFASYSPDRRQAVVGGGEGYARRCDTLTGQPAALAGDLGRPLPHSWPSVDVTAFSPDGRFFATSSRGKAAVADARLWDAATGRLIASLPQSNYVAALVFSPDSKTLATGGYDCAVHFWDTATGKRIGPPLPQEDIVVGLAFSPDGRTLAVGHARDYSGALGVVLWDVAGREPAGRNPLGKTEAEAPFLLRYSPDGRRLLAAVGPTLSLLDAATGQSLRPTIEEPAAINSVRWSPDGQHILLATADGTVRLRDAATGKPVGVPMLHPAGALVAVFSPDPGGARILAGYADGSARLWDRASQKPIGPPVIQGSPIRGLTFLPDGQSFVTTAADGTTRLWPVPAPATEPLDRLRLRLQVRTRLALGEGQVVRVLEPAEWEQRRRQLEALDGAAETVPAVRAAAFEDARARDAEQDGDGFAARWHLDRLLADEPGDWLAYARRARTWTDAGRPENAEADYARAQKLAPPEQLLVWYRHRIVACQTAGRWPVVVWYLDRALALAPDDWHLYADRALADDQLGKSEEFATDSAAAVTRGADSNFLVRVAEIRARRGQWDRAATAFATAQERGPISLAARSCQALVCLKVGDWPGYRRICALLLKGVGQTPPPEVANRVAWLCALGPNAVGDYTQPLALAELALKQSAPQERPDVLNTLGAVLYRAGRFREASERLRESIQARDGNGLVQDWAFLAMAQHRLGARTGAHRFLDKVRQAPAANPEAVWNNLEADLLCQEARALVEGQAGDSEKD